MECATDDIYTNQKHLYHLSLLHFRGQLKG